MTKTPLLAALVVVSACTDDPVSYSAPVGIELKLRSNEVTANDVLIADKNINTESGNPYAAFVSEANKKLGHAPSELALDRVTLTLDTGSTNVTALEQVMTGDVHVSFIMNDTNTVVPAAHWIEPTGTGPVDGGTSFSFDDLSDADITNLIGGNFKVAFDALAASDFSSKAAEADVELTFTFSAYE